MSTTRYAVCIDNRDYLASLEIRKLYELVPDVQASDLGQVRVIDESGEDYLYSADRFVTVELSAAVAAAIAEAA